MTPKTCIFWIAFARMHRNPPQDCDGKGIQYRYVKAGEGPAERLLVCRGCGGWLTERVPKDAEGVHDMHKAAIEALSNPGANLITGSVI